MIHGLEATPATLWAHRAADVRATLSGGDSRDCAGGGPTDPSAALHAGSVARARGLIPVATSSVPAAPRVPAPGPLPYKRPLPPFRPCTRAQHGYPVTAVAMSPSGSYVASGDASGVVRIWACDNPDQILKLETPMLGGKVLDIAWSGDGQRVVAVGEGRESFAKVIMWDSGNTVGDMPGHSKQINSVAFKPSRPFRIVTGGEDTKVPLLQTPWARTPELRRFTVPLPSTCISSALSPRVSPSHAPPPHVAPPYPLSPAGKLLFRAALQAQRHPQVARPFRQLRPLLTRRLAHRLGRCALGPAT